MLLDTQLSGSTFVSIHLPCYQKPNSKKSCNFFSLCYRLERGVSPVFQTSCPVSSALGLKSAPATPRDGRCSQVFKDEFIVKMNSRPT